MQVLLIVDCFRVRHGIAAYRNEINNAGTGERRQREGKTKKLTLSVAGQYNNKSEYVCIKRPKKTYKT